MLEVRAEPHATMSAWYVAVQTKVGKQIKIWHHYFADAPRSRYTHTFQPDGFNAAKELQRVAGQTQTEPIKVQVGLSEAAAKEAGRDSQGFISSKILHQQQ